MKKRVPLNYKTNVVNYANDVLSKKNFFSVFSEYFVLFFDFAGMDKNSFHSISVKLKKNSVLGGFVFLKRFLTKELRFIPTACRGNFIHSKLNNLFVANNIGFVGLLLIDKESFFSKVDAIFAFYNYCFSQKFVNPFGKKFLLDSPLGLDFFFKPLVIKVSGFLVCPKFFGNFIRLYFQAGGFNLKNLQVRNLVSMLRLFFFFFRFFVGALSCVLFFKRI